MTQGTLDEIDRLKAKIADLERQLEKKHTIISGSPDISENQDRTSHNWELVTPGLLYSASMNMDNQPTYYAFPSYIESLTGYKLAELNDGKIDWFQTVIHEADRMSFKDAIITLPLNTRASLSYRLLRADGTIIWVSDSIICTNSHGSGREFFGAITEITEHKEAEHVLAETLAETQVLYDVSRILGGISTVDDALAGLLDVLNRSEAMPPADGIQLYSVEVESNGIPTWAELSAWVNVATWDDEPFVLGTRFTLQGSPLFEAEGARSPTPRFFTDLNTDDHISSQMRNHYLDQGVQTVVFIPLYLARRWVGLLNLHWKEPQQFSDLSRRLYQALMSQLAIALDNIRLFEQAQQRAIELVNMTKALGKRATELETVAQVSATATTRLGVKELLQETVNLTQSRFHLYYVQVYLLDETLNVLDLVVGTGNVGDQMVKEGRKIAVSQPKSLIARAAREREPVVVNNVLADPGFLPNPSLPNTQSEMALPMLLGTEVLGVLDVQSFEPDRFDENDVRVQTTLAAQVAVALNNARLWERAEASMLDMRRLATIVENQRDFMGICDKAGDLLYVNPAGRKMLGLPDDIHDRASISILDFFNEKDAAQLMQDGIDQAQSEGAWSTEINLRSLNEKIIPVEQSITLNYDHQLRPDGFNLIMRNISEKKMAEVERDRLLAEFDTMVSQFITQEWFQFLGEQHDGQWRIEHQEPGLPLDVTSSSLSGWHDRVMETGELQEVKASTDLNDRHNAALVAPIPLRGQIVGSLSLETVHPDRYWNDDERVMVETVCEQLGLTLENLRLFEQTGQRATRERIIASLTQQIWASGEIEQVLERSVTAIGETFVASRVLIKLGIHEQLVAESQQEVVSMNLLSEQQRPPVEEAWLTIQDKVDALGFMYTPSGTEPDTSTWTLAMKQSLVNGELVQDPPPDANLQPGQAATHLALPIMFRDHIIGIINVERAPTQRWTQDEILTIQAVTEQIALALDAARLARERSRAAWRDNVVGESTAEVWAAAEVAEVEKVMQTAIAQLGDRLDVSEVVIQLNDKILPENTQTAPDNTEGQ
ncbi:MAG: GAF domain-containing protein [Chloroflexota bacterium]